MSSPTITINNLSKRYFINTAGENAGYQTFRESLISLLRNQKKTQEELWALANINLTVNKGARFGIIGANGAGKTTFLKVLGRVTAPTTGRIEINGQINSLLEVGTGFHPELTGRENIFLNGIILGMKRQEIKKRFKKIVDFAETGHLLDTPVKHYSAGQYTRLGFSVAAHLEADILLVDEVLSFGDLRFQKRCLGKMSEIGRQGRTILFVSHNLGAIREFCDQAILLEKGRIKTSGQVDRVLDVYTGLVRKGTSSIWQNTNQKELADSAYIKSVAVLDREMRPKNLFYNTEDVYIKIGINIKTPDPSLKFGFDVFHHGNLAFRTQQVDSINSRQALKKGLAHYLCRLPKGLLNKGSYTIGPIMSLHNLRALRPPAPPVVNFEVEIDSRTSPFHTTLDQVTQPGPLFPLLPWEKLN